MRRDLFAAARALVLPTIALVVVALFAPGRAELAVRIYALVLAATVIALVLLALRRSHPIESPLLPPAPARSRRVPPASLVQLENEVALGVASAFDLHYRLIPRLRSLAAGLLVARRGPTLTVDAGADRSALGDDVWAVVRSDRPVPTDRLAGGIPEADLTRVVDALEAL